MDFKILLRLLVLLPTSSWACISVVKKTKADAVTAINDCVTYCLTSAIDYLYNTDIKVIIFIRWRQSPTPSATQRASSYPQFPRWASLHFPFLNRIVSVFCEGAGDALKEKVSTLHIFSRADYCMLRSFGVDVCWNLDWMHPDEDVGKHLATDLLLILIQEERPLGRCWVSDEKTFFALVLKIQNWNYVMLLSEVTCKKKKRWKRNRLSAARGNGNWECQCNASSVS